MDWIIAHPDAATALATMALVGVGLVIGAGQIGVVWFGISRMTRAGDAREREQERRHKEAMEDLAKRDLQHERRHKEAMESGERRHEEAMKALAEEGRDRDARHRATMASLAAQRQALEALIERTAPPAAPAE